MNFQAENAVSSFFYYMWNTWSQEECRIVYGNMSRHFWEKWCLLSDKGVFGAAERFYESCRTHIGDLWWNGQSTCMTASHSGIYRSVNKL